MVFLQPLLPVDKEFRQILNGGSQTLLGGLWRPPPPSMWLSHLSGEGSRKRVNSLRGVSSRCSSFSSFHISTSLSASLLVPDSDPVSPDTSSAPHTTLLPTREQMAPELKRATREQQSGHQLQIPQTNMVVRRPSSSVTGSVFAFPPGMPPSSPPL